MPDMNNKANNNNNFFKKLSAFKRFLIIYAAVLVVLIALGLVLLHSFLKDYESGRPANTMDTLVTHIEKGDVGEWIDKCGLLSEFETQQIVTDYFNDIFTGKQISYKKKAALSALVRLSL